MDSRPTDPRFPLAATAALVTLAAGVLTVAAWAVSRGIMGSPHGAPSAVLFASGATWLAALAGLIPMALAASHGARQMVVAYFLGMALRIALCAIAGVVGIFGLRLATTPLLLTMGAMYLPLLLIEIVLVSRYLARMDGSGSEGRGSKREVTA